MVVEDGENVVCIHHRSKSSGLLEPELIDQMIHDELWGRIFRQREQVCRVSVTEAVRFSCPS